MTTVLAEKALSPENLLHRHRIAAFYEQTQKLFHEARAEQKKLTRRCWLDVDRDAFLEAELFADRVSGYASYAQTRVYKKLPPEALRELRGHSIFDEEQVQLLYERHKADAPKTCRYLEAVDYLRLMVVEYLCQFEVLEPC